MASRLHKANILLLANILPSNIINHLLGNTHHHNTAILNSNLTVNPLKATGNLLHKGTATHHTNSPFRLQVPMDSNHYSSMAHRRLNNNFIRRHHLH